MSIVLACGGRGFTDQDFIYRFMDRELSVYRFSAVIHGAYRGLDMIIDEWAFSRGIQPIACRANWDKHGRRAGPIRNGVMSELRPDWAYAFPGGAGTANMVSILEQKQIEVFKVDPSHTVWLPAEFSGTPQP